MAAIVRTSTPGMSPTMLAAAAGGVIQAAHTQWFVHGGDLAKMIAEGLEVLERGVGSDPSTWAAGPSPLINCAAGPVRDKKKG